MCLRTLNEPLSSLWSSSFPHPQPTGVSTHRQFSGSSRILVGAHQNDEDVKKFIRKCIALAFVPIRFVRIAWQGLKAGHPAIPRMDEFISYMEDTWIAGMSPINMWNVYQGTGPRTNNHLEGWHNCLKKIVGKSHPNLFKLIHTFQQEEASTHMTILQLEDGAALARSSVWR